MSDFDDTEDAPLSDEVTPSESEGETPESESEAEGAEAETESSTEEEAKAEEPKAEEEPKETKSQRKRRMRREREAEKQRELTRANEEIARLNARIEAMQAPEYEKYSNPDDYTADRAAHAAQKQILEADAERARAEAERAQAGVNDAQRQAVEDVFSEGREIHSDFDEVVRNDALAVTESMASAAIEADNSADVLYFLGKNPTEAERISRIQSPVAQALEIGKLSHRLSIPKKQQSSAPPPVKPLRGATGKFQKSPEDMTNDEYRKWRAEGGGN